MTFRVLKYFRKLFLEDNIFYRQENKNMMHA
jgi:hypothetical protein